MPAQSKVQLRKTLNERRRALDTHTKAHWDAAIGRHLLQWWERARVPALAVYWPLRGEPELSSAYAALEEQGVQLLLPVVHERDAPLSFAQWRIGEAMEKDGMNIWVPAELRLMPRPPAIVIPCLGFNGGRFRLGYGAGFYDRTLETPPRPLTVGVAYGFTQCDFASAPHDIALDLIITE